VSKVKGAAKSKTMWFSGALVVIGAVEVGLPGLREHIPALYYGLFNMGVGVTTAVLRWVTTSDLGDK